MIREKDKTREKYIMLYAMKDVANSSLVALPLIVLFEIIMIINWCLRFEHNMSLGSIGYLSAYLGLALVSSLFYLIFRLLRKDCESNFRKMYILENLYAVLIFIWALSITALDAVTRNNFEVIVYVTIMTIVPVFCYISPFGWSLLQILSAAVIILVASRYSSHAFGFIMNFSVLTVISIVSQFSLNWVRRSAYIRQYELMLAHEKEYQHARRDEMTGLLNRRSYLEKLKELDKNTLPGNLLFISFDIDGIKWTNDTKGHAAGDELICGAAGVIREVFSPYGDVYRVGGDEFMAILCVEPGELEDLKSSFEKKLYDWHGGYNQKLHISTGYALLADNPAYNTVGLETEADMAMSAVKHSRRGFDKEES